MMRSVNLKVLVVCIFMIELTTGCGGDDNGGSGNNEPNLEEFQVNTSAVRIGNWPTLDVNTEGQFLIAWGDDSSPQPIRAQRIDANGHKLGAEVTVSQTQSGTNFEYPRVRYAPNGEAQIAYLAQRGSGGTMFLRRMATDGTLIGDPLTVAEYTGSAGGVDPYFGFKSNGESVVTWITDRGVFGRRLAANGSGIGNTIFDAQVDGPFAMGVASDGTFLVIWSNDNTFKTQAQRYAADGSKVGQPMTLFSGFANGYNWPVAVKLSPSGEFTFWYSQFAGGLVGNNSMQRFAADGTRQGSQQSLGSSSYFLLLQISMLPDGRFAAVWPRQQGSTVLIEAQRFSSDGSASGSLVTVASGITPNSSYNTPIPHVALASSGRMLVSWNMPDGNIHARLFLN